MARPWKPHDFDAVYERYICQDEMQFGGRGYHLRYRSRYKECIRRLAALAPPRPVDVLDVGGGQLAVLCAKLWNDSGAAADLPGPHLSYMASQGVETFHWNLCKSDAPFAKKFDLIFFSETWCLWPWGGRSSTIFDTQTTTQRSFMCSNTVAIISSGNSRRLASRNTSWSTPICTICPRIRSIGHWRYWAIRCTSFLVGATI